MRFLIATEILLGLILGVSSLMFPLLLAHAVSYQVQGNIVLALKMGGAACAFYVLTTLLRNFCSYMILRKNRQYKVDTKNRLLETLLGKPSTFESEVNREELFDLVDGDVDSATYLKAQMPYEASFNISVVLMAIVILASLSPYLVAVPLVSILCSGLAFLCTRKLGGKGFHDYISANTRMLGSIYTAINSGRALSRDAKIYASTVKRTALKAHAINSLLANLNGLSYLAGLAALYLWGGYCITHGLAKSEALLPAFFYIERVMSAVAFLMSTYYSVMESFARNERINRQFI